MSAYHVYLFCLVVGAVFVLGGALFGHVFGGDSHVVGSGGHVEAGADSSDAPGVSAFSPTVMACFVTAFGGLGLVLTEIEATKPLYLSAPLAGLGAAGLAAGLVSILRQLFQHVDSSSESVVASLTGVAATVITPIPPHGVGEIAYVQAGTRYTAPARDERGEPVANGQMVKITRVVGSQFYVTSA